MSWSTALLAKRPVCHTMDSRQAPYGIRMSSSNGSAAVGLLARPRPASIYFLIMVLAACATGGWYLWHRELITRTLCVATTEIPPYHQITMADVRKIVVSAKSTPAGSTGDPDALIGRYALAAVPQNHVFLRSNLGPRLRSGALARQLIVGLPATPADLAAGAVAPGDRVDILLSSTAVNDPRDGVLQGALVLDVKPDSKQPTQFVIVCAITERDEGILLTVGGTAHIFIAIFSPNNNR
jgi:hypothetical protein